MKVKVDMSVQLKSKMSLKVMYEFEGCEVGEYKFAGVELKSECKGGEVESECREKV